MVAPNPRCRLCWAPAGFAGPIGGVCPQTESKELQEWELGVGGGRAGPGLGNNGEDPSVF